MKRISFLFLLLFCLILVGKGWHLAKKGFSLPRILKSSHPVSGEPVCSFTYLGKGRQFYVFENRERKEVLKLARLDFFRPSLWDRFLFFGGIKGPQENREKQEGRRKAMIENSLALVTKHLREETGIKNSFEEGDLVTLVDALGRHRTLALSQTIWFLQEQVPLFFPILEKAIEEGEEISPKLLSFLECIAARRNHGLGNKDPHLEDNFGWKEGRVIQIDIGSFYPLSPEEAKEDFLKTVARLKNWLARKDPRWLSWVDDHL